MNFSEALDAMKRGEKVARKEWLTDRYLFIDKEDNAIKFYNDLSFSEDEKISVALMTSPSLLADDWYIKIEMPKVGDIVKFRSKKYGIITNCHDGYYNVMLGNGRCFEVNSYDFELIGRNKKNQLDIIFENINEVQKGQ